MGGETCLKLVGTERQSEPRSCRSGRTSSSTVEVDAAAARIPLVADGGVHEVGVTLG